MAPEPSKIGDCVAAAIAATATVARSGKQDLVAWLVDQIGDPEMDASIPGRAADAVLIDGFDEGELRGIAEATCRQRLAGRITTTPRAYFRARCIRAGMGRLRYRE